MSEPLDPELARALREPARLVRADPALLDVVRDGGPAAQAELLAVSGRAETPEDRYAAAAMLAALFGDRGPLDQAARSYGSTPPSELVALADVPALRPALRRSLSSPVLTGLLEWATTPDAARPPLELAMAARDLQLTDGSVLLSVARRADQVAQGAKRSQQDPLARFSEVLRTAAEAAGEGGATPSSSPGPESRPTPQDPTTTGPRVTTTGIPASEMLTEEETRGADPDAGRPGADFPGTGVPVRDSIAGPRDTTAQPPAEKGKFFEADRFWPMGPPRTDRAGGDRGGDDDVAPQPPADGPLPPREPSTNDLYHGAGSKRWADRDPNSEKTRAEDRNAARNWAITFGVIVLIIVILVVLL